ncbi:MAG: GAF domain-containing protein, partial [Halodesulfurarchaeum sp.]
MDRQGRPDIRVLVVDPDGTAAASTRDRLASAEGYEIDIAESRADALGRIDGVDCVLSEYDLDEGTGMDLLAAIRERAPHLPVILYTDATVEDVATRAIAAGVTDYIRKGEAREDVLRNRIEQAVTQARAERRAAAVERVNEVLREVNAALVRADTRSAIETAVCEILAGSDPYLFAWIGEYVPAEHRLLPRAHAGMEEGFLEQIPVGPESRLPDEGPGPEALETGEVQVTQNVADDPAFDDYAEAVRDRGYRSVAAVPIGHEGDLYGLLAIYASRPEAFGPEERDLLERLGVDIGHAIHTVAVQSELRRFRQAIDYAGHAVCITDPAGTIEYVNPTFEAQTGYTAAEAVGRSLSAIQPVGPADVRGDLGSVPRGKTWVRELTATRKDGERYHA